MSIAIPPYARPDCPPPPPTDRGTGTFWIVARGPEIPGESRRGAESAGRVFPYFGKIKPGCGFGVSGISSFKGLFDATSVFGCGADEVALDCGAGALGNSCLGCGCTSGCGIGAGSAGGAILLSTFGLT